MNLDRADGIVLRVQPVTESSLIVTWYTRQFGKLKTVAKGARRLKSPFRGKIDLFYVDEIVFLRSRQSDLHLLHDCFLVTPQPALRSSWESLTTASYTCELVELATMPEDANAPVFELLSAVLATDCRRTMSVQLIWYELQLLAALGWQPKWAENTGVRKVLHSLASARLAAVDRVRLSAAQISDARAVLWRFWDQELGRSPRSRKLLSVEFER